MKKILGVFLVTFLLIFGGCVPKPPQMSQVEENLKDYFGNQGLILEETTVERQQDNENVSLIDVNVKMSSPFAEEISRKYSLTYNYYDKGGWNLDSCFPIKSEEWIAKPKDAPYATDKELLDKLFVDEIGYSVINQAKIRNCGSIRWYSTAEEEKDWKPEDVVRVRHETEINFESNIAILPMELLMDSALISIRETFNFKYDFNPKNLRWELTDVYSSGAKVKMNYNLVGKYKSVSGNILTIENVDEIGNIKGSYFDADGSNYHKGETKQMEWRIEKIDEASCISPNGGYYLSGGIEFLNSESIIIHTTDIFRNRVILSKIQ